MIRLEKRFLYGSSVFFLTFIFIFGQKTIDEIKYWKEYSKKYPLPKNAKELELKYSFPSREQVKKDIYIWMARNLATDPSGNIYVSDPKSNRILKFDSSGRFLLQIGKKGEGPGELLRPYEISFYKDLLVVNDVGNRRIQFFDQNGRYVKSFKVFKLYFNMVVSEEGLIFIVPNRLRPESFLVDVLNGEGRLLYSFAEPLILKNKWGQLNQVELALNQNGEIILAFVYFAIVRKYSRDGTLLAEFKIDYKIIKHIEKSNMKRNKANARGFSPAIHAVRAINNKIYLLIQSSRVEILEINLNGDVNTVFWNIQSPNCFPIDFIFLKKANKIIFYLLTSYPEYKIDVFDQKTKIY